MEGLIEDTKEETLQQKSSVKVIRNSRGYNWEVKVYDDDADKALEKMIVLEGKCKALYGDKPVEAEKPNFFDYTGY